MICIDNQGPPCPQTGLLSTTELVSHPQIWQSPLPPLPLRHMRKLRGGRGVDLCTGVAPSEVNLGDRLRGPVSMRHMADSALIHG